MPRKTRKKAPNRKKVDSIEESNIKGKINEQKKQSDKIIIEKNPDLLLEYEKENKISNISLFEEKSTSELKELINQLIAEKIDLEQNLKQKEELIINLKAKLLKIQEKTNISKNSSLNIEETEKWRDSALTMSQFIADKMGYTQGQILEKFGMVDA